ncbi:response regulator [Microbulbifer hydrolyticus]|uniref:Excisionase family DNA binding protein n=1 Tax=Microbulbifer hydrolyticus TaxID=48074 RepID=A0A6P1TC49_9GAMM|nr:response regulator [Microbulbifer hydrolyticus]MBB5212981.1 excisionase family DNA binding protein [Microbulbifer hydrolyticus]QHQ40348.1 response regulator [Microbulbifer hydrolyticus]
MSEVHVLTTGEAARYCGVNFRTVIRWIERGQLKAYKLPGRGDHRICVEDFVGFLRDNAMPVPAELGSATRKVLLVADSPELAASRQLLQQAGVEVEIAGDSFTAGALLATSKPAMLVLDTNLDGVNGFQVLDMIRCRSEFSSLSVLVIAPNGDSNQQHWLDAGADAVVAASCDRNELVGRINLLLDA